MFEPGWNVAGGSNGSGPRTRTVSQKIEVAVELRGSMTGQVPAVWSRLLLNVFVWLVIGQCQVGHLLLAWNTDGWSNGSGP